MVKLTMLENNMIYILTTGPFPYGMASVARLKCYMRAFKRAHLHSEIDIFERTPEFGKDRRNFEIRITNDGFYYWYAGGCLYGSSNRILRKFEQWLDKKKMVQHLKCNLRAGDFVLLYFSDVDFQHRIIDVAHSRGAFVIKELNEVPGKGNSSKSANEIKKRTEKELMCRYDGIICISQALVDYSKQFVDDKCKVVKVPILVDLDKYDLEDKQAEAKFPYIFHSGSLIERKDGVLGMLEAFAKALPQLPSNVRFVSTGSVKKSPEASAITKLIDKYQLQDRVIFTGYLSTEELKEKLSHASLVIINKNKTEQNKYCFSTKLGEYLAAGKPVAISDYGEAVNWMTNGKNAYVYHSECISDLSNVIVKAFRNKDERMMISRNGKMLCRKSFDYVCYSDFFLDYFKGFNLRL